MFRRLQLRRFPKAFIISKIGGNIYLNFNSISKSFFFVKRNWVAAISATKQQPTVLFDFVFFALAYYKEPFISSLSSKYWRGTLNGGAPLQLFDSLCFDSRIVISKHSHQMNRKMLFVSNNNNKNSISQIFELNIYRNFFEMHNLYIMGLYALRFDTRKVSGCLQFVIFQIITCKIVFVFGATIA